MATASAVALILIGDSDIQRWPAHLLPSVIDSNDCCVSGHNGATLEQVLPHIRLLLEATRAYKEVILVVCAGENDIAVDLPVSATLVSFRSLLDTIFASKIRPAATTRLLLLGPKIEPWLDDDEDARKQYIRLSQRFDKICKEDSNAANIVYIDCLTMFCGETGTLPGALFGGQAKAMPHLFAGDGLHLSDAGYRIWQHRIDEAIKALLKDK